MKVSAFTSQLRGIARKSAGLKNQAASGIGRMSDRLSQSVLSAIDSRLDALEELVGLVMDAMSIAGGVKWKYGLGGSAGTSTDASLTATGIPFWEKGTVLMCEAAARGSITALLVNNVPVTVGDLSLLALDPTAGQKAAGYRLPDCTTGNNSIAITATTDSNTVVRYWLQEASHDEG